MLTLNIYAPRKPGDINDQFPVQTFTGHKYAILTKIHDLLIPYPETHGIVRIELVMKDEHPNANLGQAPIDLDKNPEVA